VRRLPGCLVGAIHASEGDEVGALIDAMAAVSGRIVWNDWPTGVAVTSAQHHGGPYPASTNSLHTSVGAHAIERILRPVSYQNFPARYLPYDLRS